MRLGEMLLRDGRLTEVQLKQSLAAQARDGGRLGTVLFEHGFIDLEALTVYLGLELGIPIATGAMLERAKRAAVRLLQPAQAFKFKVVPLVVQDRQLIAAVEDPHDFATLEALTHQTGYRVLPRVAPEVRIYYYIERYYGVARPARYVKFGETPRGDETAADPALPAPPLPGLPPAAAAPVSAPGPRPRLRSMKMAQMFDDSESLELDAEDLLETLDADDAAPAERATTVRPHRSTTPPIAVETPVAPDVTAIAADDALAALATVTDRDAMIEALLGYAAGAFEGAVLFTVRDQLAFGWKAVGRLPGRANVEHLLIPLEAQSIVQLAVAAESGVFHGEVAPSTVNSYLHKVLGIAEPKYATAGVITIGKRVVNVLYGHGGEMSSDQIEELRQVCAVAAEAYARLIAVRKKK
jgi:Type II secretion system (T2SS), protein E, N-terminal domain